MNVKELIKRHVPRPVIDFLKNSLTCLLDFLLAGKHLKSWHTAISEGHGVVPLSSDLKINIIREYGAVFNCNLLVETGTLLGGTPFALKDAFDELYTIELSENLYQKALVKFQDIKNVHCYHGDSTNVLPEILEKVRDKGKVLFWLDGHYSEGITAKGDKNTPIMEELELIFNSKVPCEILIDDARCFGFYPDYPSILVLERYIKKQAPEAEFRLYNDIIRITFEN